MTLRKQMSAGAPAIVFCIFIPGYFDDRI